MGDTINVPLMVRTHELSQLKSLVPAAAENLRELSNEKNTLGESADELERIFEEHIEDVAASYPEGPEFAAYVSMPAEDWTTTISWLDRGGEGHSRNKVWWLKGKLADRLDTRVEEFTD